MSGDPAKTVVRMWLSAYRTEVILFLACFVLFAAFSAQRFLRQSEAPHFVYQAKAWLDGRLDLDPQILPNMEDWACVHKEGAVLQRCGQNVLPQDRWYVSFPWFPAVVMLPFVAVNGYQFNDTSFGVFVGALTVALFYGLLRMLRAQGESDRTDRDNLLLALTLAFGTLFFYCTLRGEVWFSAEVMGVGLSCLYLHNAVGARRPLLAGLFFSMAVLTRTPLLFTGLFFLLEALCPGPTNRLQQLKAVVKRPAAVVKKLSRFALGALPLALLAGAYNQLRFGRASEFGHKFLFNNRVNEDTDRFGLFNLEFLGRNLKAAFLLLPTLTTHPLHLDYNPHGLSLFLTLPFLFLLLFPRTKSRLTLPLWLTVALCALPGLFYMNDGYIQFGFRFSLDYTPYLVLLLAVSGWSLKNRWVLGLLGLGVLVNFWGAAAFHGYTEYVRHG